jgi:hypothetical protein
MAGGSRISKSNITDQLIFGRKKNSIKKAEIIQNHQRQRSCCSLSFEPNNFKDSFFNFSIGNSDSSTYSPWLSTH